MLHYVNGCRHKGWCGQWLDGEHGAAGIISEVGCTPCRMKYFLHFGTPAAVG